LKLYRITTPLLPAGSWGNVCVWAKDEAAARRFAAAHMRKAEMTTAEVVDQWVPRSDPLGKPGDGAASERLSAARLSFTCRHGAE
jgi:hypothetical protein